MKLKVNELKTNLIHTLKQKKLRNTRQRQQILEVFFSTDGHLTVDELYEKVKKINPKIGYATIHRTLKLLAECGIAEGIKIGNQKIVYEHKYGRKHHDHLMCLKCGKFIEIFSEELENIQDEVANKHNFKVIDHKLIIYGLCEKCRK